MRKKGQVICEGSNKIIIQSGEKENTIQFSYHSRIISAGTSRSASPLTGTYLQKGCDSFAVCILLCLPQGSCTSTTAHLLHLERQMRLPQGGKEIRIPQRMSGTSFLCLRSELKALNPLK